MHRKVRAMSNKQVYITLMGRSGWAVVNSFHASVIETDCRPEEVILLYEAQYTDGIKPVVEGLEIVQGTYSAPNVVQIEVPTSDAHAAGQVALDLVQKLKKKGSEVALDITGGRKALVAGSLLALKDQGLDHVYYLAIETVEGVAKPYLMIPERIQKLIDLVTNEVQSATVELKSESKLTDVLLSRDCIMIVLNQAYRRGERIKVKAPLIGVDLLELNLPDGKVTMLTDSMDYGEKRDATGYRGWDHPTYSDLRRCLCFCGLIDYQNGNKFHNLLTKKLCKSRDLTSGARKAVLSLDSNMYYNGFPSYLEKLETRLGIPPKDVVCITPFPVVKEIQDKIKWKYKPREIHDARDHYNSHNLGSLIHEFVGQNTLETRVAKMAKSELTKFMKRPTHEKTRRVDLPKDKEDVDHLIVDELERFADERGVSVNLVSADKNMHDFCELARDVGVQILVLPSKIPRTMKVTDRTFVDLLIGLSLLYGVVELEKTGYLFGEYRGKRSEVYTDEVKLRFWNSHRARIVEKRAETCKKLRQLDITK